MRWLGGGCYVEYVLESIKEKLVVQNKHPAAVRGLPYVVAIDCEEFDIRPEELSAMLVGSLSAVADYPDCGQPKHLWHFAVRDGRDSKIDCLWKVREADPRVLRKNRRHKERFPSPSLMENWAATLRALLLVHRVRDIVQWIPNPWATGTYDEPRLLSIGAPPILGPEALAALYPPR